MPTVPIKCGHCGLAVAANVVALTPGHTNPIEGFPAWLQCPSCMDGSVRDQHGTVYPSAPAGGAVPNLPDDIDGAWREVRTAHAVAAYTAAEMMCRKILMHLAVGVVGSSPGKSFAEYVTDLDAAGYVAPGLRPVVDQIRQRGNTANHDLPASSEQDSQTTMAITEHLLRTIYELPGLVPSLPTP